MIVIQADGLVRTDIALSGILSYQTLEYVVNGYVDTYPLRNEDFGLSPEDETLVMVVQEENDDFGKPPMNPIATLIAQRHGACWSNAIKGDVAIAAVDKDGETVALTSDQAAKVIKVIKECVAEM